MYVNLGHPNSHDNIFILQHSCLYNSWPTHLELDEENFPYIIRDPKYMAAEMFTFRKIWMSECPFDVFCNVVNAFNKMHVCYNVHVERGIGGLKSTKIAMLIKQSNAMKPKHTYLLGSCALLTNFLHQRMMDLSQKMIGNRVDDLEAHE